MRFARRRRQPPLIFEPAAQAERLVLQAQHDLPVTVLTVSGELSRATAAELEELVIETIYRFPERIVLDLRAVEFLDASGINSLQLAEELSRQTDLSLSVLVGSREMSQRLTSAGISVAVLVDIARQNELRPRAQVGWQRPPDAA